MPGTYIYLYYVYTVYVLTHLILTVAAQWGWFSYYDHFTDEETEHGEVCNIL